jgi:hypothetical protein
VPPHSLENDGSAPGYARNSPTGLLRSTAKLLPVHKGSTTAMITTPEAYPGPGR